MHGAFGPVDYASLSVVLGVGSLRSPTFSVCHRRKRSIRPSAEFGVRLWHLSFFSGRTRLKAEMGYCARDSMRFLIGRLVKGGPISTVDTDVKAVRGLWPLFKPGQVGLIRYRTARSVAVF